MSDVTRNIAETNRLSFRLIFIPSGLEICMDYRLVFLRNNLNIEMDCLKLSASDDIFISYKLHIVVRF